MRHLNGVYTQDFNRRHGKVGHLFQGRFKAVLVDRDAYLLEVCRYVELNPVRAGVVGQPGDWPWSSYLAHVGVVTAPAWLDVAGLHGYLLGREARDAADARRAARLYVALVVAGRDVKLWDTALRQQMYLGDETFVQRMQALADPARQRSTEVPRAQRRAVVTLGALLAEGLPREQAMLRAYVEGGMTMTAMAQQLGLSVSRVSRIVASAEAARATVQGRD